MKKILIIAAALAMLCGCGNKNKYTIKGEIPGMEGIVTLVDESGEMIAQTDAIDGKFEITGTAEIPSLAILNNNDEPLTILVLEPGTIVIDGTGTDFQVSGTVSNDNSATFNAAQYSLMERYYQAENDEQRQSISDEMDQLVNSTIDANLNNYFGLFLLTNISSSWSGSEILAKLDEFSPEIRNTPLAGEIREFAENKSKTDKGNNFIDITLANAEGETVTLSEVLKDNKYVLLDFWASWCGPCMKEVPFLKEDYANYHEKGFEIYGVSLDSNEDAWKAAMTDNEMTWINVSVIGDDDKKVTEDYMVQSIPANYLIDQNGKIIETNLRGEALGNKLKELLGE